MRKAWQTKTVGDVCEFQRGLTYAKSDEVDVSDNVVLRATNIDLATNLLTFDELKYISDKVVVPETKKVKKGSLLICTASGSKSHLGKVAYIDDDYGYAFGGFMGMLTPLNELLPKYLFHLMTSEDYKNFIVALSDGANINNLTFNNLKRFPVPVPPLPEQQRIVGLIDTAFEDLAIAKANAEKNLQNARALFDVHLQAVFAEHGPKWKNRTLASLCAYFFDSAHRTPTYQDEGIPALRPRDVVNGRLSLTEAARVSEKEYEIQSKRHKPSPGDIVYSRELSYGWAALLPKSARVCLSQGMCVFRPNSDIDSSYFLYVLNGPAGREQAARAAVGTSHPHINLGDIKSYLIPLPSLVEQRQLVKQFDVFSAEARRLVGLYERKLAALDALKQSLLHQAFSGQLTTTVRTATIIPFPTTVTGISTTDLHAGLLAIAFDAHERRGKLSTFGHVKAEKISHMIESYIGIDLGRSPVKDAAGPNDFPHLQRVEHRARMAGFFDFRPVDGGGYQVKKLGQFDKLIQKTKDVLASRTQDIAVLLDLMVPMTTQQAEVFSTVHAAWNNLLLEKGAVSDDEIVSEAREKWHPAKLAIPREKFVAAIDWLRKKNMVPTGKGKRVEAKQTT
jgi:type I restriction enzyme, S subunit